MMEKYTSVSETAERWSLLQRRVQIYPDDFRKIFEYTNHLEHYNMMMGNRTAAVAFAVSKEES